ncbi:MAG: hypothetical protein DRI39_08985 [Chloroflexi bacterium]|nr:MAG: hypothetical protein DRI39_08985 [Chloroflexota bacterium]RLC95013.1 MAG: hypothetical protein DRI40_06695 [Chloroflexota bacterium]
MAQQAKRLDGVVRRDAGRAVPRNDMAMDASRRKCRVPHRSSRWYPKKVDDVIIQRWAEACSQKHDGCRDCPYVEECQDLVDRLIACMDVQPPGHREILGRDQ